MLKADNASPLTVQIPPQLDANTAPGLESSLELDGIQELIMDFGGCQYVSSAGIRVILKEPAKAHPIPV